MMISRPPTGHELRRNIALALTAVFVITLLMLCDLRLCFMVFLCVVFTMVDVVGIISWWDVQIDVVSATYLVLVVGLCVDYSTHIAHAFKVNRGERSSREFPLLFASASVTCQNSHSFVESLHKVTISGSSYERARVALSTIGPAILNGGTTTFLALVLLAFSTSYAYLALFKENDYDLRVYHSIIKEVQNCAIYHRKLLQALWDFVTTMRQGPNSEKNPISHRIRKDL